MTYKEPSDCPWFYEPADSYDPDIFGDNYNSVEAKYEAQCNVADDMCSSDNEGVL